MGQLFAGVTRAGARSIIASSGAATLLFAVALAVPAPAVAQTSLQQNLASESGALDFFRPPPNLFQLTYGYRTTPGSGSEPNTTREVTTQTIDLRYDHAFDLSPGWVVITRSDLPLLAKNPITDTNPNGDYLRGIGDADFQAALVRNINQRLAFGFGMRVIAPTGDDVLGSGKWQLMPIIGARFGLPEISSSSYFEPVLRYDVSVAGDPTKKNISNLQFGPAFSIGLPERWYVTFYPSEDIRINFGDPITGQTGRLFLPFDVRLGKKFSDNVALSLEIGIPIIRDYPVYDFKAQLRFDVTF
jgi:hypothetical protein